MATCVYGRALSPRFMSYKHAGRRFQSCQACLQPDCICLSTPPLSILRLLIFPSRSPSPQRERFTSNPPIQTDSFYAQHTKYPIQQHAYPPTPDLPHPHPHPHPHHPRARRSRSLRHLPSGLCGRCDGLLRSRGCSLGSDGWVGRSACGFGV